MNWRSIILLLVAAVVGPGQETRFTAAIRTRIENWDWFGDDPAGKYTFSGSLLRLGINHQRNNHEFTLELGAPLLVGLPATTLGAGGNYFNANHAKSAASMVFLKQGFYRWKPTPRTNLRLGRFEFLDGSEVTPSDPFLATLKATRIQQRLIGNFLWTHVGRSFDGGQVLHKHGPWTYTALGITPTRGVFQTDGWGWNRVALSYASATRGTGTAKNVGEVRVFGIYYQDFRPVVKVDNRELSARQADLTLIKVGTYGAHYIHSWKEKLDLVLWGAVQSGAWGPLAHRAGAGDVEAGWRLPAVGVLSPWIRGGYYRSSGDGNPADGTHGTFFQILPTPRPYARMPFYNGMNSDDRFAVFSPKLGTKVTINCEFHHLNLASAKDLWYQGGGVYQPWTFGYSGRPSNGNTRLGNLYDVGVDYVVNRHWSVNAYYGYAQSRTLQSNGHLAYLELNWKL